MRAGDVIDDRFEIEKSSGAGGMGEIFRATDRQTGATVALKLLHRQAAEHAERFLREANLLASLQHPAIVKYVAHGYTSEGVLYLAMEWLAGVDLAHRLRKGPPLTVEESLGLVETVAHALALTHGLGVVHRDIKPNNIYLVDGSPEHVKLLDFGIARLGSLASSLTAAGIVLGSPSYMSPEQARAAPEIDARSDVFSLGCVLFRCVAGRTPFAGDDVRAILGKILLEEAPRLADACPDVPPALDELTARMLAKIPAGRPADGGAVVAAIAEMRAAPPAASVATRESPTGLTLGEKTLLCVILAGPLWDTARDASAAADSHRVQMQLREAARTFGATLEVLMDASVVVTMPGRGDAMEQAARAARCALAMRKVVPLSPMALATGSGLVADAWPVGDVLDRVAEMLRAGGGPDAQSLETSDEALSIRIDATTAGLLDSRFHVGSDAAGAWLLRGEREKSDSGRTLLGRETPLVGRERELAFLDSVRDECLNESVARAVLITAPGGAGKSRLRSEFLLRHERAGGTEQVLLARGDAISAGSPFAMVAAAISRAAGILGGEPRHVRCEKLRTRVARHVARMDVPRVTEFLGELVGAPVPDGSESPALETARQDAALMGGQMCRAWEDWLAAESTAHSVILVLEDLQWGDLPTVRFVDSALRNLAAQRLMVVAFARPEVHQAFPGLWSGRSVTELKMPALTPGACERLVRNALGDQIPAATIERMVERSGGNAFFLEELIRALAERKGTHRLPETVLAIVQARLESVETDARRVLRAASILGSVFWKGAIQALIGDEIDTQSLERCLERLIDAELIRRRGETRFASEAEYTFRNEAIRVAAYSMLTDEDRVLGHRLAGDWLEAAGERAPVVLAEHFESGGEHGRATGWYLRAAEGALEGNDFGGVLARAERGVACGATDAALATLLRLQAEAHRWRAEYADTERLAAEAMKFAAPDSNAWYRAVRVLASATARQGNTSRLVEIAEELVRHGASGSFTRPYVVAASETALQLLLCGSYEVSQRLEDEIGHAADRATMGDRTVNPEITAWLDRVRAIRAGIVGNFGLALELHARSGRNFVRAGDLRLACVQRLNVGGTYMVLGDWSRAESACRESLASAERLNLAHLLTPSKANLGLAIARLGDIDRGREIESEAVTLARAQADRPVEAWAWVYLAIISLQAGDPDRAESEATAAAGLAIDQPTIQVVVHATLANAHRVRGNIAAAVTQARAANALMQTLGGIDECDALVRLAYAEAMRAAGEHDLATSAIRDARERLQSNALKISSDEHRSGFLERVPEHARTIELAREWLDRAEES